MESDKDKVSGMAKVEEAQSLKSRVSRVLTLTAPYLGYFCRHQLVSKSSPIRKSIGTHICSQSHAVICERETAGIAIRLDNDRPSSA
jgi:hypothetical protein